MNTLLKLCKISYENNGKASEAMQKFLTDFDKLGFSTLMEKLKSTIKFAPVEDWVKEQFLNDKSYTLEVDKEGSIHAITINSIYYNTEIKDLDENHYYVHAAIAAGYCFIDGGNHYNTKKRIVDVSDMEDFLGIKIEEE